MNNPERSPSPRKSPCDDEAQLSPERLEQLLDEAVLKAFNADPSQLPELRREMNQKVEELTKGDRS